MERASDWTIAKDRAESEVRERVAASGGMLVSRQAVHVLRYLVEQIEDLRAEVKELKETRNG
jgi:hypothetical protein